MELKLSKFSSDVSLKIRVWCFCLERTPPVSSSKPTLTTLKSKLKTHHFCFQKVQDRRGKSLCVSVCPSVCVSLASDSSETIEVIISKLGKVIAPDMRMPHVLIILTLTFSYGHTELNPENK